MKGAIAYLDAIDGRSRKALQAAADLESRYRAAGEANASSIGAIFLGLGRADEALVWLTRAIDARDTAIGYLKVDPLWDPIRGDPRFQQQLARINLR
jgi:hypothetical protein